MRIEFQDDELRRLAVDSSHVMKGLSREVVKAYRKVIQKIESASNELDLYALRGLRLKPLRGDRSGTHSMRLNDQYRLIVTFKTDGERVTVVMEVVDYH